MSLNQKITKAVALWPKDELRPWLSFPKTLDTSIRARLQKMPPQQANKQLNALNNLLDNVYWNKYIPKQVVLKPQFKPSYYESLTQIRRKEEKAPLWKRLFKRK
ncbi:hypothetical protein POMI540_4442 [Schizosaccharomyces pombe]|uniref:Cytochrome B pre-mRNA-processing protein 6 n=1 Tax=Schizosaccharomyces pombe (strain 972 / ATCC 24843) TaxID=284812 RepID=CBP6_SCHPO|nr:putative respiratory chain complex assembly protein Cbp6 [Schizosaccharomyces pombe]O43089.1 RecName: Full=Cytochrome B pre-mRNA-processing protein 6 [Schizosaccharomyces pombe 972h-]CAA17042.1 mitochondrial respiratory chain complex assembly protein Cbp6 (predicted) [Schizosaccharomyces pombe]|eukprot:NP_595262.1 putative respiratory chain complex assembly protein Cbp6 [Schizosaccharomyces pombe]